MANVGAEHTIIILGSSFEITLGLPFSWKLFFYASIVFSLASFVYSVYCPEIVRDYHRFSDFLQKGKGSRQITEAFGEILRRIEFRSHDFLVDNFLNDYTNKQSQEKEKSDVITAIISDALLYHKLLILLASVEIRSDRTGDAFWHVRGLGDKISPVQRWACGICYATGFGLILIVLFQNFLYVLEYS